MVAEINTQIEIYAPPSLIWQALTDFASYPQWNTFIRSIDGEPLVGSTLRVRLSPREGKEMSFEPTVVGCEKDKKLNWIGKLFVSGIFDGLHSFELEPLGSGRTLLRQRESFSGYFVSPILWFVSADTEAGFRRMNEELKARCE